MQTLLAPRQSNAHASAQPREQRKAKDLMRLVAERTRRFDFTEWFWGDPIAFDGLLDTAELNGETRYADFVERYLRRWCEKGKVRWLDVNCPGYALNRLYALSKDQLYLDMTLKLADHLYNKVPKSLEPECHIYQPDRVTHRNFAWVDSIYHVPPYFCSLAEITNDPNYYDWAMYVMDTHVHCLLDEKTMLFPQGRDLANDLVRGYGWGRGMGWGYLGIIDTYALLPETHPGRKTLEDLVQKMSPVLLGYQHYTGAWRNLVHDQESPLEASTAAMLGAAFEKGVRLGLLGNEYEEAAERAWTYTKHHIDEKGGFFNVSACSWAAASPGDDTDLYKLFYTEVNVWGQGGALRAAGERILANKD
jgi:unsaturated rhamnogalacturonyl hydrolase